MRCQFLARFRSLRSFSSFSICLGTALLVAPPFVAIGCSRQPELISPAAKSEPDTDAEKSVESASKSLVAEADSSATEGLPTELAAAPPAETIAETGEAIAQNTTKAKPKPVDTGVKPATHVVEVKLPTRADRSRLDGPAQVAKVMLSEAEQKICKLNVGDQIPEIALPNLSGKETKVADLLGEKYTIIAFWNPADPYSTWQIGDLTSDVIKPYEAAGASVVSICSGSESAPFDKAAALAAFEQSGAKYPCLIDADGATLGKFGSDRMSRTYLVDAQGKILWFDMEYSRATRRETKAALSYLIDGPPKEKPAEAPKTKPAAKAKTSK